MTHARAFAVIALITLSTQTGAQPVPEGIHSDGKGDANVCGFKAENVGELEVQISRNPKVETLQGTPEYRAYALDQKILTFTTSANKAHPAVACRTFQDRAGGGSSMQTEISYANSRENCDWLYREFELLDARMMRELEAKK